MGQKMNWDALRYRGRQTDAAKPKEKRRRGPWTHVQRGPVREFTDIEKAQWASANLALLSMREGSR